MLQIELNMYQAVAVAALVLLLGRFLVSKIPFLTKYCIPEPVVGGVVYAVVHLILRSAGILEISFDNTLQSFFMTVFFCSVGYTACFRLLKKGGVQVLLFLLVSIIMVALQNGLGAVLAGAFHLDPRLGLAVGSIPMVGGHGTAGAFGPVLEEAGVAGANAVAIASATFGLVAGCMIGGPLAYRRIHSLNLKSTETATGSDEVTVDKNEVTGAIDSRRFLDSALYLAIAIGAGTIVSLFLNKLMTFPSYIGAMVVAAIIRNIVDATHKDMPMEEISTIGSFSLSLFLGLMAACRACTSDDRNACGTDSSHGNLRLLRSIQPSRKELRRSRYDIRLLWIWYGCYTERYGKHAGDHRKVWSGSDRILRSAVSRKSVHRFLQCTYYYDIYELPVRSNLGS